MCVLVLISVCNIIIVQSEIEVNFTIVLGGNTMGKNIVVITGSPRKNGNSFAMTDAFINEAKKTVTP